MHLGLCLSRVSRHAKDQRDEVTVRLLHVIPTLDRAGAEKQLMLLAAGLPREDFEVHVCALTRGGPYERVLRERDIPVQVIGKRFKADPVSYFRLRRYIRRLRPDVVHTWMFAANAYGRQAALAAGVRALIATERCVDPWKAPWQWRIDRHLATHTHAIVGNSQAVCDSLSEHGLPEDKLLVIRNGVPPAVASDITREELLAQLDLPRDTHLIGTIGRLWPQKRTKFLIWAAELIHLLRKDCCLLVIGDGPERAAVDRYRFAKRGEPYTRILGHRDDVWRILPHLDVLWQGSSYEGMPNAVLEAMAAGVPVVATDIAAHREIIIPGHTGVLLPIPDRAGFCRETDRLLRDRELAKQLAARAREQVCSEWSVERMVQQHRELYREVLAPRAPA